MIYVKEPTTGSPAIVEENPVDGCTKDSECGAGSTCNTLLSLCISSAGSVKRETADTSTVVSGGEITDTDGDGMPDSWETENGLNPNKASDAADDADRDGLTNLEEYERGTSPRARDSDRDGILDRDEEVTTVVSGGEITDTDGDGMPDSWETENGLNPNKASDAADDADRDGLTNLEEYERGTSPRARDSDRDGILDRDEEVTTVVSGGEITDTDGDGMPDSWEEENGLDSSDSSDADLDSDSDGATNEDEYISGSDPNNPDSDNDSILDGIDNTPIGGGIIDGSTGGGDSGVSGGGGGGGGGGG